MDRYRSYDGRRHSTRRRHSTTTRSNSVRASRVTIRLFICVGLFVVAAFMKLLFPSTLTAMGDRLNSVVNYKAALTSIGEGLSGEKKFTTALGEAFSYAFTGELAAEANTVNQAAASDNQAAVSTAAGDSATEKANATAVSEANGNEESTAVFSEAEEADVTADTEVSATADEEESFADAVIAAFIQSQEGYSDFAIPAGVTYEMPRISVPYSSPMEGTVSSPFGYRVHPTYKTVKFHYGTDIVAKKGTPITAFADGKVIAAGESTTFGKYVLISEGDIQTEYAHCESLNVSSGQTVKMGDKIATIGDTGNATDLCLHFELKVNGQYVNPEYYIQWT